MAVHPDSVIETWVSDFDQDFYNALTDQENWAYLEHESISDELNALKDYFGELQEALNDWREFSYKDRNSRSMKSLINVIYTYKLYESRYGVTSDDLDLLDAKKIFNIAGFTDTVKGRPVDYYDDLEEITFTSVKLQDDIDLVTSPGWRTLEAAAIEAAVNAAQDPVRDLNYNSMFSDAPVPSGTPLTKAQIAEWIFIDLNYKWAKDNISGIDGIVVPEYIENPPEP